MQATVLEGSSCTRILKRYRDNPSRGLSEARGVVEAPGKPVRPIRSGRLARSARFVFCGAYPVAQTHVGWAHARGGESVDSAEPAMADVRVPRAALVERLAHLALDAHARRASSLRAGRLRLVLHRSPRRRLRPGQGAHLSGFVGGQESEPCARPRRTWPLLHGVSSRAGDRLRQPTATSSDLLPRSACAPGTRAESHRGGSAGRSAVRLQRAEGLGQAVSYYGAMVDVSPVVKNPVDSFELQVFIADGLPRDIDAQGVKFIGRQPDRIIPAPKSLSVVPGRVLI